MLAKWNPFNGGIARSSSPMPVFDELFRDLAFPTFNWATAASTYMPAADVLETEDEIQVKVDLPGHDPKSLQVRLEGDTLTIQSERKQESRRERDGYLRTERSHGTFARSFVLPNVVDPAKCAASFENGVLTVTLPKREEARPRKIDIKVQS